MKSGDLAVELHSLAETERFGRTLGITASPGDVITLNGTLGAGKTTLTQFIGAGLEIPAATYITSPTFSLLHEYRGRLPLYHMDLYRLSSEEEIAELGFMEYIYGEGLTVIEWPDRLGTMLPDEHLAISLRISGENSRSVLLSATGRNWPERMAAIEILFLSGNSG